MNVRIEVDLKVMVDSLRIDDMTEVENLIRTRRERLSSYVLTDEEKVLTRAMATMAIKQRLGLSLLDAISIIDAYKNKLIVNERKNNC